MPDHRNASQISFQYPSTFLRRRSAVHRDIEKLLCLLRESATIGLHLGAADIRIPKLINCDLYDERADRRVDAVNLSEFQDGSVDLIEHHHMLEHLSFEEVNRALGEWHRVLAPHGYLVMTFPDVFAVCKAYLWHTFLGLVSSQDEELTYVVKMLVGSQEHPGMFHRSHYDRRSIRKLLAATGFEVVFCYPYPRRMTPSLLVIANCGPRRIQ